MGKKRGRRTALTPEKHKEIVTAIRAGCPKGTAIRAARITPATFHNWMNKGERIAYSASGPQTPADKALVDFFDDVRAAENECERFLVSKLLGAVNDGDTSTAKWMLERRYAKHWVLRTHIGVSGSATEDSDEAPIEFVLATPKLIPPATDFGTEGEEDGSDRRAASADERDRGTTEG